MTDALIERERETLDWLSIRGGGDPFGHDHLAAVALYAKGLITPWRAGWWTVIRNAKV